MPPLLPWMVRDDPSYDPNRIGAITQAKVLAALVEAGKFVLLPSMNVRPYDLGIEEEDGRFYRVQCKTGRIFRGRSLFAPTDSVRRNETRAGSAGSPIMSGRWISSGCTAPRTARFISCRSRTWAPSAFAF